MFSPLLDGSSSHRATEATAMSQSVDLSLQPFFNLSPDLLCIRNADGYFQEVNAVWTDILGWTLDELRSRPWIDFVHPDDVAATLDLEQCVWDLPPDADTVIEYKVRFRHQEGHYRWLKWRLSSYKKGLSYGIAQDATEQSWSGNAAYRAGIQEALKLRDLAIAASSVGIVIANARLPDMPLIYVNPAFETITGYSAAEVLGTNCRFLQGTDKRQAALIELRAAIKAGTDCTVVLQNYRKDGSLFWNELHISPIYNQVGELTHFVGVQSDITARKQAEAALKMEQEKSERLLLNVLPQAIAERLKQYQIGLTKRDGEAFIADGFEEVTVLFADIVGFTTISSQIPPTKVIGLLNRLFSRFDELCDRYGLEKIKTIGDEYMVVSGVPTQRSDHAEAIADMALAMQQAIEQFGQTYPYPLKIRIGISTGPVVAGVIGTKKFAYDLWGDTVNVASRMESSGEPGRIQVTEATYQCLSDRYQFEKRGSINIKGKGAMTTYWLIGKTKSNQTSC